MTSGSKVLKRKIWAVPWYVWVGIILFISQVGWTVLPQVSQAVIRVGIYENPPLQFVDEEGLAQGIVVDVMNAIAADANLDLEYVACAWAACLEQLESGQINLMGAIAFSAERAERFDFTEETLITNWGQIYTRKGLDIESLLDLEGQKIGVLENDIHFIELESTLGKFDIDAKFVYFQDYHDIFSALSAGEVEAGLVNHIFSAVHGAEYEAVPTGIIFNPIEVRFAATKYTHRGLLSLIDSRLAEMKDDQDSAYKESLVKWLSGKENNRWAMPDWMPTVMIIIGVGLLFSVILSLLLGEQVRRQTAELRSKNQTLQEEIADRRRAESNLKESEVRFRSVVQSAQDAIITVNSEGKVVLWNPAAEKMFRCTSEEMLGKDIKEIIPTESSREDSGVWAAFRPNKDKNQGMLLGIEDNGQFYETEAVRDGDDKFPVEISITPWDVEEQNYLTSIIREISERKEVESFIRKNNRDLGIMVDWAQEITALITAEDIYSATHRAASSLMDAATFIIVLNLNHDDDFSVVYLVEKGAAYQPNIKPDRMGLTRYVIQTQKPVRTGAFFPEDYGAQRVGDPEIAIRSVLAVPMKKGDQIMGMLSVQSPQLDAYTSHDQQMLELIAYSAAIALEKAQLFAEVQQLAITDGLTGLYNRRYLDQQLLLECQRALRNQRNFGFLLLDLDQLKLINDTYGHPAGDRTLIVFSNFLQENLRASDVIARYGGDEFAIILPETDLAGVQYLAKALRDKINLLEITWENQAITVTASIGVGVFDPKSINSAESLIKNADHALYQAKNQGKNQVVVMTPPEVA